MSISIIQSKFTSLLNPDRIASYDQETNHETTMMLIHSMSRFLYVTEGKATIRINGNDYSMTPGTMIAILPWDVTQIIAIEKPITYERIIYNLNFINLYLRSDYNPNKQFFALWHRIRQNPVIHADKKQAQHIHCAIERLRNEVGVESVFSDQQKTQDKETFSEMYTVSLVIELLVLFVRTLDATKEGDKPNTDCSSDPSGSTFFIGDLLNFFYSHLQEKITLERLNKIFFVSQSTISKRLKETLGYTFQELITAMRIYKAMDLLTYTDFSLQEIAKLVGMNDAAHLVHSFEAMEDMTPNEFRQNFTSAIERKTHLKASESSSALKVVNDILLNYQNPLLTPQAIAEKHQLSLAELNRITLYYVERSATEFIASLRINRASELLLRSELPVTEIALIVGFKTLKTFYRYFRKTFSTSPTEFRKQVHFQQADGSVDTNISL